MLTYVFTPTYGQAELEDPDSLFPLDHAFLHPTGEQLGSLQESKRAKAAPYTMYEILEDANSIGDYFMNGPVETSPPFNRSEERNSEDIGNGQMQNADSKPCKNSKNGRRKKAARVGSGIRAADLNDATGEEIKDGLEMRTSSPTYRK